MPENTNVELVGANDEAVPVQGTESRTRVRLDAPTRRRVADSLALGADDAEAAGARDRVFLNLENVRGQSDAAAFRVYVGVGDDEDASERPERLAGSIAPFGVSQASDFDDEHAGQGLTFVLGSPASSTSSSSRAGSTSTTCRSASCRCGPSGRRQS